MPIDYKRYPANWHAFSRKIRLARAQKRCEKCRVRQYGIGYWREYPDRWVFRYAAGNIYYDDFQYIHSYQEARETADYLNEWASHDEGPYIVVVLTVAHLDAYNDICQCEATTGRKCANPDHVLALCQHCHLTYDAERHRFNARRSRAAKSGQLWLLDIESRY